MNQNRSDDGGRPKPESLAAYVDGELSPDQRALVETWLAEDSETAAEVAAHQRLRRLCQNATPPEPDEAQWDAVLSGLERRLPTEAPARRTQPWAGRRRMAILITGLTAASVLLAVTLCVPSVTDRMAGWLLPPVERLGPVADLPVDPLPVASADDIEIISMDDGDRDALIVGEPPVRGPLELLRPGEVDVEEVFGNVDGMNPKYFEGNGAAPMLISEPQPPAPDSKEP
jgi:hypothetical protein